MRALIILALLGAALAVPRNPQRIVGGEDTDIKDHPFMANMLFHLWGIWWLHDCGGSLLTSRTILSAAHCYFGDSPNQWSARLGSSLAMSGCIMYGVSSMILHERYSSATFDNDVALLILDRSVVMSDSVQPARIPGTNYNLADGTIVRGLGWGELSPGGYSPDRLQRVDVNVINQELCTERYVYLKTQPSYRHWPDVTDGMLCTGILDSGGKDTCQGDNGGPMTHNGDVVVGVISWGRSCAHHFYPGVNARVSMYSDWIVANAQ